MTDAVVIRDDTGPVSSRITSSKNRNCDFNSASSTSKLFAANELQVETKSSFSDESFRFFCQELTKNAIPVDTKLSGSTEHIISNITKLKEHINRGFSSIQTLVGVRVGEPEVAVELESEKGKNKNEEALYMYMYNDLKTSAGVLNGQASRLLVDVILDVHQVGIVREAISYASFAVGAADILIHDNDRCTLGVLQEPPCSQVLMLPQDSVSTGSLYTFSVVFIGNNEKWTADGPVKVEILLDGAHQPDLDSVFSEQAQPLNDDGTAVFTDLYRMLCEDKYIVKNRDLGVCVSVRFVLDVKDVQDDNDNDIAAAKKRLTATAKGTWYRPCIISTSSNGIDAGLWTSYAQPVLWNAMVSSSSSDGGASDVLSWALVSNMLQLLFMTISGQSFTSPHRALAISDLMFFCERFVGVLPKSHSQKMVIMKSSYDNLFKWLGPIAAHIACSTHQLSRMWFDGYIVGFMSREESVKWLKKGLNRVTDSDSTDSSSPSSSSSYSKDKHKEGFLLRFGTPSEHYVMSAILPGQNPSEDNITISMSDDASSAIESEIEHLQLGWWLVSIDERYLVRNADDTLGKLRNVVGISSNHKQSKSKSKHSQSRRARDKKSQSQSAPRNPADRAADLSTFVGKIEDTWKDTEKKLIHARSNYHRLMDSVKRETDPFRISLKDITDWKPYFNGNSNSKEKDTSTSKVTDYDAYEAVWRCARVLVKKFNRPNPDQYVDDFLIRVAGLKSKEAAIPMFLGACWTPDALCEVWELRYSDPTALNLNNSEVFHNLVQVQESVY